MKVSAGQRQAFPPGAAPLLDAERDVPVFERFQAVVGEGNPVNVRSEVGQDRRASARRLAVGHPSPCARPGTARTRRGQRWSTPLCPCPGRAWRARERARARPHSGARTTASPLATGPHQGRGNGHADGRPGPGSRCGGRPPCRSAHRGSGGPEPGFVRQQRRFETAGCTCRRWCERARGRSASGSVKVTRKYGTGRRSICCCASHRVAASF